MGADEARRGELSLRVSVPATSGNCGPGFDVLGLALELRNVTTVRLLGRGRGGLELAVSGEGEGELEEPERNRFIQVLLAALEQAGEGDLDLRVEQLNRIPLRRGLGSSAAAAVGGALAAISLVRALRGEPQPGLWSEADLASVLSLALPTEGHPDNIVPALVGGLCLCWTGEEGAVSHLRLNPPGGLTAVLAIPEAEISTEEARRVLSREVPLGDAVFSMARAALLVAATCSGRLDLLGEATRDRLHQPVRIKLLPAMGEALARAREAGAVASWVSGSGSTVLALCPSGDDSRCVRVAAALKAAFDGVGGARALMTSLATLGANVRVEASRREG